MSHIPDMSRNRQQTLMAILGNMASHHSEGSRRGVPMAGHKEDILLRAIEDVGNCRGNLADMGVLRDLLVNTAARERALLSGSLLAGRDPMQDVPGNLDHSPGDRLRIGAMEDVLIWLEIKFRLPRGTWKEGGSWP